MKENSWQRTFWLLKNELANIGYQLITKNENKRTRSISPDLISDLKDLGMEVESTNYKVPYSIYKKVFKTNNFASIDKYLTSNYPIELFDNDIERLESIIKKYQFTEKPWKFKFKITNFNKVIYDSNKEISLPQNTDYTILKVDESYRLDLKFQIMNTLPSNPEGLYVIIFNKLLDTSDINYSGLTKILGGDPNEKLNTHGISNSRLMFIGNNLTYPQTSVWLTETSPKLINNLINLSNYIKNTLYEDTILDFTYGVAGYAIKYKGRELLISYISPQNFGLMVMNGGFPEGFNPDHETETGAIPYGEYTYSELTSKLDEVLSGINPEFIFYLPPLLYSQVKGGTREDLKNILKNYLDMEKFLKEEVPNMMVVYKRGQYHYIEFDENQVKFLNYKDI